MSAQAVPHSTTTPEATASEALPQEARRSADSAAAQQLRCTRYDQMAKAASAGLMSHPQVESAIVEISGDEADLVFHLNCTVKADCDPSDLMDTVSQGVIPNLERMLGTEFTSRRLQFNRSLYSTA